MAERGTHTQAAPWYALIGDGFFDFRHIGKDAPGATQIRLALGGKGYCTSGAQQQAGAKALLGARDDPADRRRCQPQCTCGGRQAALFRHGGEHHHVARPAVDVHLCSASKGVCQKCHLPPSRFGS